MEGATHRRQGKEVEVIPSTTKKAPEVTPRPPDNTTVKTATKEVTKDGVLKPSERAATGTFNGEGSKPRESSAAVIPFPTNATQGPSSATREPPLGSGDATGPGNSVDVKQPSMLARHLSKKDSRKPSVPDTHQEGSGGVPARGVRTPPPLPPLPPPTVEENKRPNLEVTRGVGGGTTGRSLLKPPPSAGCTYLILSYIVGPSRSTLDRQ